MQCKCYSMALRSLCCQFRRTEEGSQTRRAYACLCTLHTQPGIPQPCPREPPPTACAASPSTPWKASTSPWDATAVSKQLNHPVKFCSAEVHSAWSASCRGRHRLTTALEGFAAKKLSAASRGILPLGAGDSNNEPLRSNIYSESWPAS